MTVGVCWEIYEYIADHLFTLDMQKDAIVHSFNTVMLDATNDNIAIPVKDIADVIIVHSDGSQEALALADIWILGFMIR